MKKWMKILLGIFVIGLVGIYIATQTAPWIALCPGIESRDLKNMNPSLAGKINEIIKTLDKEGYKYNISSVYRSPEKQMCYYKISKVIKKVTGQKGLTGVSKGCHNHTVKGKPSSLAIDMHMFSGSMESKAKFYQRLRELARSKGLKSGGDFDKSNPLWAKYDLGWDPGHVEIPGCMSMVKKK